MALAAALVVVAGWGDRVSRSDGPESPVVRYAEAVGREDLAGALDQLAPAVRPKATDFVAWQLGNRYAIIESAVRTGSILDRLAGRTTMPLVVVTMEIQGEGIAPWRATEELPVESIEGRWYLLKPPLGQD